MLQEAKRHKHVSKLEAFEFLEDQRDLHIRVGTLRQGVVGGCLFGLVGVGVLTVLNLFTRPNAKPPRILSTMAIPMFFIFGTYLGAEKFFNSETRRMKNLGYINKGTPEGVSSGPAWKYE